MKNIFKSKRNIMLFILGILIIGLVAFTITYAYVSANASEPTKTDVNVTGEALHDLSFTSGDPLNISPGSHNLNDASGNLVSTTTTTATLVNNALEESVVAQANYSLYLQINTNTYEYSTGDRKIPEMILTITDPNGDLVTENDYFDYVSTANYGDYLVPNNTEGFAITGFDITEGTIIIPIVENYQIDAATTTNHEWTITLSFMNLDEDQSINAEKTLDAEILIQKTPIPTLASTLIDTHYHDTGLYQHTTELANGAGDDNYRYSGSNSIVNKNWVCFGSDADVCPDANKYRIIGIFDGNVKLIKQLSIGAMKWDLNDAKWEGANTSSLAVGVADDADINKYLNTTFYNSFSDKYKEIIYQQKLYIGYNTNFQLYVKQYFDLEIVDQTVNKYNIGLMYISDYAWSTTKNYWKTTLNYYGDATLRANNWLYSGITEWTIIPRGSQFMMRINSNGYLDAWNSHATNIGYAVGVRPSFYLKSNTRIESGTGTSSDPFRLMSW